MPKARSSFFRASVESLAARLARMGGYDIVRRPDAPQAIFDPAPGQIAEVIHEGVAYRFFVANPRDSIQEHFARGEIYEAEELTLLAGYIRVGGTFVDIGANVGNHSLFALLGCGAARVIAFEPALYQHTLLCANLLLNGVAERAEVHKLALSDRAARGRIENRNVGNWGAASVSSRNRGEFIFLAPGDSVLAQDPCCVIKIDVEGHEMAVLRGLERFVTATRPVLFVEVDDENAVAFHDWIEVHDYRITGTHRRYRRNENFLAEPRPGQSIP